jgi:hypothetical protein
MEKLKGEEKVMLQTTMFNRSRWRGGRLADFFFVKIVFFPIKSPNLARK